MSDFNFKVSLFGFMDMIKFKKIVPNRRAMLAAGDNKPISGVYPANTLAEKLHPKKQSLTISEIKDFDGAGAKSYTLVGEGLALFRPGQYLAIDLEIGSSVLKRAYTLCSSPDDALKGIYEIAVKRTEDGFASAWILDNWKVGDVIHSSGPEGFCYYEPLRDERHVIGVAGGSGITPMLSMARAIVSGWEDFELTILYGSRTEDSIMFREELNAIASCPKVKVVHILSEENKDGFEHGFVTAGLIQKYAGSSSFSVFMCGPDAMYRFVNAECEILGLDKKHIRMEVSPAPVTPKGIPGYSGDIAAEYTLTLSVFGNTVTVPMKASETVLTAMDRAGIKAPAHCRGGECGWCRTKLISGKYFMPKMLDKRRSADRAGGYIHPCSTYPLSDMTLLLWPE